MSLSISIAEKKEFIRWFLKSYKLKKRECIWILKYLLHHDNHLKYVQFVRDIKFCPRAILMSTHCSNGVSFRFFKQSIVTEDVEKSFHDIRLNNQEPLFIQLNFLNAHQCPTYALVLEENPFIDNELFLTHKEKDEGEDLLNHILYTYKLDSLRQAIDKSLDQRDKTAFLQLCEQLKEIEQTKSFK